MAQGYRKHHYVPEWYQKRFRDPGSADKCLYYLDLHPCVHRDSKGAMHTERALRHSGPGSCFAEENLYRLKLGEQYSTVIETEFFGEVDAGGSRAVEYFANFAHPSVDGKALEDLLLYMTTQKLRTPKGLDWLAAQVDVCDKNGTLRLMVDLRHLYSAVWAECVWQIADANGSPTKFIVSDHPVTVYNRRCGPRSAWCRGSRDPDIRYNASHTIFPLDRNKVLILTNLTWVCNPYQKETDYRPNPNLFRGAMFNFLRIQTMRRLSEQEVREINFIIKNRAYRYIAAEKEEWLYPETYVSKSDWHDYGKGYLLMPDPRPIHTGGEIFMMFDGGRSTSLDQYGRRPWEAEYRKETKEWKEYHTLQRFKGEFAYLFGPERRGRSFDAGCVDPERDSEDMHQSYLSRYKKERRS